jgi:tetratricopeptide (TPR) repeat protein
VLSQDLERKDDAEAAYQKAVEGKPGDAGFWHCFGIFLACKAGKPIEAEAALRRSVELAPDNSSSLRDLGVLLYCGMLDEREATDHVRRAYELDPADSVSAAVLAICSGELEQRQEEVSQLLEASRQAPFWNELLDLCRNYPPFGKIVCGICDLVQERDRLNRFAPLHRAVALAELGDFPRASVVLEDALVGDPIEQLALGRKALEVFLAAAIKNGRVGECIESFEKKNLKDVWRPIYEALKSVEAGSSTYLKRVAVEIREPALLILRRIAPALPGLSAQSK